ncbi:hypothetical protein [Flavobacterium polysaccharolyticum]|uniref:Bacteriocin-type signal sequence-containing protein n=1 Tax=Flavobacterium polysaccharolyticum TaxID=3133148 RepID=A0ABU9NJD6_9FLAO
MLKNILKLKGAQELTKNEQKSINGGYWCSRGCSADQYYSNTPCKPTQAC